MRRPLETLRARVGEYAIARPAARLTIGQARRTGIASASRPTFAAAMRALAVDCTSVLDVGTGLMHSLARSPCRIRIGLDVHRPYLEQRVVADAVPIIGSALDLDRLFVANAVDLVTLIDVVEHFESAPASDVLRQAEGIARRRVVLFTPRGVFPQAGHDAFGLGGEEFQRHRSSWEVDDLSALGFRVIVFRAFHGPWNESFVRTFGSSAPPVDALLAFKDAAGHPT